MIFSLGYQCYSVQDINDIQSRISVQLALGFSTGKNMGLIGVAHLSRATLAAFTTDIPSESRD